MRWSALLDGAPQGGAACAGARSLRQRACGTRIVKLPCPGVTVPSAV